MRLFRTCALGVMLSGCANSGQTVTHADLQALQTRLDEEARRSATSQQKLDDLENRVFLLTDQIESQKVASLHRATHSVSSLPVVTLHRDGGGESAAAEEGGMTPDGEQIEFTGAARSDDPNRVRPTLRIDGDETALATRPASSARKSTAERRERDRETPPRETMVASAGDNLGVAPAPPIRASQSQSQSPKQSTAPAPTPIGPSERSAPAGEPIALYRSAYEDLRAGRHDDAAREFRDFVKRYPRHDYADNAQYWLGEVYYDQKRYDEAAPEFRAVVTRWPTGNKAPDAMLKLGFTQLALGKTTEGRATLRELPAAYPRTDAARLAEKRLATLSTEGTK